MARDCKLELLDYRMPRRISGRKREDVTGGWRTVHDQELLTLFASENSIRVLKSKRNR
jgi:hypothetical protein